MAICCSPPIAYLICSIILQTPITVPERVQAYELSLKHSNVDIEVAEIERVRFELTLESIGAEMYHTELNLSDKQLKFVGGLRRFEHLQVLNLSHNQLTTLKNQGLHALPHLISLDLRYNQLESLADVIQSLRRCKSLQHLWLERSTRDQSTLEVNSKSYISTVLWDMKGLISLEGREVPNQLTASQMVSCLALFDWKCSDESGGKGWVFYNKCCSWSLVYHYHSKPTSFLHDWQKLGSITCDLLIFPIERSLPSSSFTFYLH